MENQQPLHSGEIHSAVQEGEMKRWIITMMMMMMIKVSGGGDTGDWTTVKIPGSGHDKIVQENSWILTNLSSASTYECIVQVK